MSCAVMEDLYTREKSPDMEDFYFVQQVCKGTTTIFVV
jgi:hypothetical protein